MQRKYQPMRRYSVRKFSFGKNYAAFVGNLLYMVSNKIILCAVLLESFKNQSCAPTNWWSAAALCGLMTAHFSPAAAAWLYGQRRRRRRRQTE